MQAHGLPSIFHQSTNVSTDHRMEKGATAADLLVRGRASLTGIACVEDLVGGAEDALGGTLGKRLVLAP